LGETGVGALLIKGRDKVTRTSIPKGWRETATANMPLEQGRLSAMSS